MLGYVDNSTNLEQSTRTKTIIPEQAFPGWQVFASFEWFMNIKAKYRNIVESDQ